MKSATTRLGAFAAAALLPVLASASSHREAPFIIEMPKVDGTDLYMFRSYEGGREGYVTLLANYIPFQQPGGGPNYYPMDEDALYEIHIDNNGDAVEDITFQFDFTKEIRGIALNVGGKQVPIPLKQAGPIGPTAEDVETLNVIETYTVTMVRGERRNRGGEAITHMSDNSDTFVKPVANIGNKTLAEYEAYANDHIYDVNIPGCEAGRLFVGQRNEGFVINVGEIFDLLNYDPLGAGDAETDYLAGLNVNTLALEVPVDCLTGEQGPIIGAWTTASLPQVQQIQLNSEGGTIRTSGPFRQVSRLGMPLVNEVVIGLPDKDRFNQSKPAFDAQFLTYVTNPTLPALIETLFPSAVAPTQFPREDLVQVFLTGIPELNQPQNVVPAEMLRLNTSIPAVPAGSQDPLGVLGGDKAGFPNGRRPGDDVVDIELRVAMGALLPEEVAPAGQEPFTDGAHIDATFFDNTFRTCRRRSPARRAPTKRIRNRPKTRPRREGAKAVLIALCIAVARRARRGGNAVRRTGRSWPI